MSSRADDLDADEASEHADESAGPRIARRIWGPVTKDVSESIGAPAAVASVQLQPRCIPFELLQEVHALVPVEVLHTLCMPQTGAHLPPKRHDSRVLLRGMQAARSREKTLTPPPSFLYKTSSLLRNCWKMSGLR